MEKSRHDAERGRSQFYWKSVDLTPLRALADTLQGGRREMALAFAANLEAAATTARVPYTLFSISVQVRRFTLIHAAERIRALKPPAVEAQGDIDEKGAYEIAWRRFSAEMAMKGHRDAIVEQTFAELGGRLEDPDVSIAASELLRQGAVLTWGAVEALLQDLHAIRSRNRAKKGARAMVEGLLPGGGDGRIILREAGLWVLFQRRHIIVHKRGVIDHEYLTETGEPAVLGSVVQVAPPELSSYLDSAALFADKLLRSAS